MRLKYLWPVLLGVTAGCAGGGDRLARARSQDIATVNAVRFTTILEFEATVACVGLVTNGQAESKRTRKEIIKPRTGIGADIWAQSHETDIDREVDEIGIGSVTAAQAPVERSGHCRLVPDAIHPANFNPLDGGIVGLGELAIQIRAIEIESLFAPKSCVVKRMAIEIGDAASVIVG